MIMETSIKNVWTVVSNSNRVRLFAGRHLRSPIEEIGSFVHPEARLKEQELKSASPGRAFDSFGKGRHSMEHKVDAKKQQRINFADEIAEYLDKSRAQNKFSRLILIASPDFLGELRNKLSAHTMACIELSIDKDLTLKSVEEIQQHIAQT